MFSSTNQRNKYLFGVCCLVLAGLFVWHSLTVNYSSDDGFIAFQYVKNLIHGNGLVYNPGERVEGYNNFLWIILLAVISKVLPSVTLLHISSALGVLFGALTVLLVCRFSRTTHRESLVFSLLAGAFVAAHSGLAAWATGGLETTMYAFLLFAASYSYVIYQKTGKRPLAVPVLFAVAALTRPDAIILFGITMAHAMLTNKRRGNGFLSRNIFVWALAFIAIYLPYYAWRYFYYGYPLPNTFYAKVGGGINQYFRGAYYLLEYFKWYGYFIVIPPILLLLRRKREDWIDYFALLVGTYLLYLVYVGGDGLAFFRFVAYIAPLFYVLVQEGISDLFERAKRMRFAPPMLGKVAVGVLACASLVYTMRQTVVPILAPSQERWFEPHSELAFPGAGGYLWFDNYFVERQAIAAKWLNDNAAPGSLVASTPAGSIAYYSNYKVLDMLGLNDVYIAHTVSKTIGQGRAGHEKGDGKYVLSRSPDYILMGNVAVLPFALDETSMADKLILKSERELWADPEFHKNYELHCVKLADTGLFQYFTFFKKKAPGSDAQATSGARANGGGAR